MINKLQKLQVGHLILSNLLFIILFMVINSIICEDGLTGGECVKHKDNFIFIIQMVLNFLFYVFYLIIVDRKKWGMLLVNVLLTGVIYIIAATLHSTTKSGLF